MHKGRLLNLCFLNTARSQKSKKQRGALRAYLNFAALYGLHSLFIKNNLLFRELALEVGF